MTRTTTPEAAGAVRRADRAPDQHVDRREIVTLAVPMTLASAVGILLPLVLLGLMGRMGPEALYVRSVYTPLVFVFAAVQTACDTTNQVLAARRAGAGRRADVGAAALSVGRVWFGAGVVLAVVIALSSGAIGDLLRVEAGARDTFTWFVRAMAVANLGLAWPMLCSSSLRGAGHPRRAAVVTLTGASLEVAVVAGLGLGAGAGMVAVPLAMGVAIVVSGTLGLVWVRRAGLAGRGSRAWQPDALRLLTGVGVPIGLSYLGLVAMNVALVRLLSPFGAAVVAGYAAGGSIQNVVQMSPTMLGSATAIVMNRRLGADARSRLTPILRAALVPVAVVSVVPAVACWLGRVPLGVLLSSDQAAAGQIGRYLGIVAPTYLVLGFVLAAITILQQTGGGRLAIASLGCYVGAIIGSAAYAAHTFGTPDAVYAATAATNATGVVVVVLAVAAIRRRDRRAARPGSAEARRFRD